MSKTVEEMLNEMNQTWERGKDGPVVPPDGEYKMQLVSAEIRPNKAGDKLLCFRQHTIVEGEYANVTVRDFISLTENQIFRLKQWIEQMQYEAPEDLADVPAVLDAIIAENPTYIAFLKSSGDFLNITDFEVVDDDEEESDDAEEVDEDSDEGEEEQSEDEESEETEEATEEATFEDQDHMELVTTATACGVELPDGISKKDAVKEMKGYDWDYNDFKDNPEGLAIIKKYGMDVVNEPAPPTPKKTASVTKTLVKKAVPAAPAKAVSKPAPVGIKKPSIIRKK